jgi:2'-5' RNA ligase
MISMFDKNTYIVLELPEPYASKVHQIRIEQQDEFRASLPNEITLAGSGGVGPIAEDQNPEVLFKVVNEIAQATKPFRASFTKPRRFPSTDIVVMELSNEKPFRDLHERLVSSPLKFQESKFPYTPHCTLRSRSPLSDSNFAKLSKLRIDGFFNLDTLAIYSMPAPMKLLHRVKLIGK